MKKILFLLLVLFLFLFGCSGTQLSPEMLNSLGLPESTKVIADDMTVKQLALYQMHTKVAQAYYKAKEAPTFTLTPKVENIGGMVFISQVIEYREKPDVITLPDKMDVHPAWGTMTEIAKYGLIGYGIHEIAGTLQAGYDAAQGPTYNGPLVNSANKVGGDQSIGALDYTAGDKIINSYNPIDNSGGM